MIFKIFVVTVAVWMTDGGREATKERAYALPEKAYTSLTECHTALKDDAAIYGSLGEKVRAYVQTVTPPVTAKELKKSAGRLRCGIDAYDTTDE